MSTMSGIDARGFRVAAPALPELQDEQAELLAFWLRDRGWVVAPESDPGDLRQVGPHRDDFYIVRQHALELSCALEHDSDDEIITRAEAFRKFLMGEKA